MAGMPCFASAEGERARCTLHVIILKSRAASGLVMAGLCTATGLSSSSLLQAERARTQPHHAFHLFDHKGIKFSRGALNAVAMITLEVHLRLQCSRHAHLGLLPTRILPKIREALQLRQRDRPQIVSGRVKGSSGIGYNKAILILAQVCCGGRV